MQMSFPSLEFVACDPKTVLQRLFRQCLTIRAMQKNFRSKLKNDILFKQHLAGNYGSFVYNSVRFSLDRSGHFERTAFCTSLLLILTAALEIFDIPHIVHAICTGHGYLGGRGPR